MISTRYILKRLFLLIPVVIGVATFVFAILRLVPGDPARLIAGAQAPTKQVIAIRQSLGLDDPLWVQYGRFLYGLTQFDLGQSYVIQRGEPVAMLLRFRLPVTIELAVYGEIIGILLGIPLGILSAVKQNTLTDYVGRVVSLSGISIPIYWSGPLLILVFSQFLNIFPPSGRIATRFDIPTVTGLMTADSILAGNWGAFESAVLHLIMPSVILGIYSMALISRMMRSSMLEIIRKDYIRTARAKGQGVKITVMKHGFRNAMIPVLTVIGIQFGALLGGAVLTETVFSIGGIGTLLVNAIETGDYPVVQGTVLIFAFLFTIVNLGVDITYSYLDPRIEQ